MGVQNTKILLQFKSHIIHLLIKVVNLVLYIINVSNLLFSGGKGESEKEKKKKKGKTRINIPLFFMCDFTLNKPHFC